MAGPPIVLIVVVDYPKAQIYKLKVFRIVSNTAGAYIQIADGGACGCSLRPPAEIARDTCAAPIAARVSWGPYTTASKFPMPRSTKPRDGAPESEPERPLYLCVVGRAQASCPLMVWYTDKQSAIDACDSFIRKEEERDAREGNRAAKWAAELYLVTSTAATPLG